MEMTNEIGELLHKAEMLEMDFLQEMGVDTFDKYSEVEKHIQKIIDMFTPDKDEYRKTFSDAEFKILEQDLEDKINGIESASANLSDLKRLVRQMKKSDTKTNLMDCIERMEMDLC